MTFRPAGSLEVYQLPSLEFSEPVQRIDSMRYRLLTRKDTTWVEMPRPSLVPDSASAYRKWTLQMPVTPGSQYKFEMDTLAVSGIYGRPNAPISPEFKAKERNEYASLTLRLSPDTIPGYVEVLNSSDSPVQRARVVNGVVTFPYLTPSDYYARFIADTDSSGTFTPGSVELNRQPEDVYYYPGLLSLRRHDRSESWNLYSTPVDMQKPMKLLKTNRIQPRSAKPPRRKPKKRQTTPLMSTPTPSTPIPAEATAATALPPFPADR